MEVTSAVIVDLVDRLGAHRVVGQLSPGNLASARLRGALGVTFECFAETALSWRGARDDNLDAALSADERH